MASVNKVIIIGNLGQAIPEVRYTAQRFSAICNISGGHHAASWKDKESAATSAEEETEWHRITFFDKHGRDRR